MLLKPPTKTKPPSGESEPPKGPRPPVPVVSSHGATAATILFLGGYPLSSDLNSRLALSGIFESRLNSYLQPHDISIQECYRAVFIREKLSYSGTSTPKLRAALQEVDLPFYEQLLFNEIVDLRPNVIVPLDDVALGAVFPHIKTITKPRNRRQWIYCYRGSVLPLRGDWQVHLNSPVRVIPAISPQILLGDTAANSFTNLDYARIINNRFCTLPISEYGTRWVCRTAEAFHNYVTRSLAAAPAFLTFDIETYGGLITCIGFSFNGVEGVSVPFLDETIPRTERALMLKYVDKLLRHPIPKVNQNIKYDWIILERFGFSVTNVVGDTMLLGSCLYPELPKGLDFYTSIYTPIPYYKDEGKDFDPKTQSRDKLYLYNALDGISTHYVYQRQLEELSEDPLLENFYKKEMVPLLPIYKRMDETGIRIDDEQRTKLIHKYQALFESNLFTLREMAAAPKFLANSHLQVGRLLYEELGFPKRMKRTESGELNYKTDKGTLDDLLINHTAKVGNFGKSIIARIIVTRKLAKVLEYLHTPISLDGRFRSTSNLCGTETGRSSYSKSLDELFVKGELKRVGRSLQTISKHGFKIDEEVFEDFEDKSIAHDLRSMFVPSEGWVFVEADGSAAEARHVAVLSEDWDLLASFDARPKVHAKTAALLFDVDAAAITKDWPSVPVLGITYYDLGKRIRHAGNYKTGAGMVSLLTHLPLNQCQVMLTKFHAGNPNIRDVFHKQVEEILTNKNHPSYRKLRNPLGRVRTFFASQSEELIKEGIATIPQSAVSDHTKFSIPRILEIAPQIRFLAEMHDGLLMEVKKDTEMFYAQIIKTVLERPMNYRECTLARDFDLVVPAEVSVGDNWMDLKEVKVDEK